MVKQQSPEERIDEFFAGLDDLEEETGVRIVEADENGVTVETIERWRFARDRKLIMKNLDTIIAAIYISEPCNFLTV